jgi:branched-chain amino acid aminotransferase
VHTLSFEKNANPLPAGERAALLSNPGFGRAFTDHVVTIRYSAEHGWHDGKVGPSTTIDLRPAAMAFHHGQEIFEGMKAYRLPDGGVALFRPNVNARRFGRSADRLAMPRLPEELFLESVRAMARVERDWIPTIDGGTLYLRPFMIATEAALTVRPATDYLFCVAAAPAGAYFTGSAPAVTLWVSEHYIRAAPGGTGEAKCAGNYGASLAAQAEAAREGCDQVLFLDAVERRWVEELGAMNVFFVFADGTLRTPPLTGTILPGVTRDSIITLARGQGLTVHEEPYAIDQWQADAESGRLREAFACGTAAVVAPIGKVKGRNHSFTIGDGGPGPVSTQLRAALVDIQTGRAPDQHSWLDHVMHRGTPMVR